ARLAAGRLVHTAYNYTKQSLLCTVPLSGQTAGLRNLYLDLDVHAGRKDDAHEHIDGLGVRLHYIDDAVVRADLKVLVRVLIDERGTAHGEQLTLGGQRHGANHARPGALRRFDDAFGRLIDHAVIVSLEADT